MVATLKGKVIVVGGNLHIYDYSVQDADIFLQTRPDRRRNGRYTFPRKPSPSSLLQE